MLVKLAKGRPQTNHSATTAASRGTSGWAATMGCHNTASTRSTDAHTSPPSSSPLNKSSVMSLSSSGGRKHFRGSDQRPGLTLEEIDEGQEHLCRDPCDWVPTEDDDDEHLPARVRAARAEHALHIIGEYEVHRRDHFPPPVMHGTYRILNVEQPNPAADGGDQPLCVVAVNPVQGHPQFPQQPGDHRDAVD